MKDFLLFSAKIAFIITILCIALSGCKKSNDLSNKPQQKGNTTPVITLPDSAMFVGTTDSNKTTIYLLDARTGSLVTKYNYPADALSNWCVPMAGNGFLYDVENDKINAVNMNTGVVLWTDSVKNYSPASTILHNNTFYGFYSTGTAGATIPSYVVYALDATKKSNTFLWKYQASNLATISISVKYYNGIIYITDYGYVVALDAKTGALKWTISNNVYSLSSINNGVIIAGNTILDAATGNQTATVPPSPLIPSVGGNQTSFVIYVSQDLFFVKTDQNPALSGSTSYFLSAIDRLTGANKWTVNSGGYASGIQAVSGDTSTNIEQVWNNELIVRTLYSEDFGRYGGSTSMSFGALDINTGLYKSTYNVEGTDINYFITNNTMYCSGDNNYNPYINQFPKNPVTNYLYAINLFTGAQKWNNDKLLSGYGGPVYLCVYSSGNGYSPYIQ